MKRFASARWHLLLGLIASATPWSAAALEWDHLAVERSAWAGDDEVTALFPFKNTGTTQVAIVSVVPNCTCTTAEFTRSAVPPGGTGVVKAIFVPGDRIGRQEKLLRVTTSDPSREPVTLTLRIDIAELVTCTPRAITWRVGEAQEKPVELTALHGQTIALLEGPDAMHDFSARTEVIELGKRYRVWLTPLSSTTPTKQVVSYRAHLVGRATIPVHVYALVQ